MRAGANLGGVTARLIASLRMAISFGMLSLPVLVVAGCGGSHIAYNQVAGEAAVDLDSLSEQEKTAARDSVSAALRNGLSTYRVVPGDKLEAFFYFDRKMATPEYMMAVGDEIEVDFAFQPEVSRKVTVRPDGMITLPRKGDIRASGMSPAKLADNIRASYSDIFRNPEVTVSVLSFNTEATELDALLESTLQGRARSFPVSPQGTLHMPMIPPVRAAGLMLDEVERSLNSVYDARLPSAKVSLGFESIAGNQAFIFGEVRQPGAIAMPSTRTILQMLASAGGPLPTAATDQIRVIYWDAAGRAAVRQININTVVNTLGAEQEMIVPPNSVIYVPPSGITKANRFIDQYVRQLFLFNGTSIGVNFDHGNNN